MTIRIKSFIVRNTIIVLFLFGLTLVDAAPKQYNYSVDLTKVVRDRYKVTLECSDFKASELTFQFPKIIPGTYRNADYGKYIKNLKAYDSKGENLPVKKEGKNTYHIKNASDISRIEYWVNDTYDARFVRDKVYPMAGTNNEKDKNFIINAAGVFGYFENEELNPLELKFKKPDALIGLTVMENKESGNIYSVYTVDNYHDLIDSPLMFAEPDTASFMVNNIRVSIGVARELGQEKYATRIAEKLNPAMNAAGDFLGVLPADEYSFIIYFADRRGLGNALDANYFKGFRLISDVVKKGLPIAGALEHNTSSFYYLLDLGDNYNDFMMDVIVSSGLHEFMHIITPLTLHSELIGDFDYANPQMSQHLWLYEGLTEYFADLIRVRGGLITPKEFLFKTMRDKIVQGEKFPNEDMSFTEMSVNALEGKAKRQYIQVYRRGAVIGMLLDLEIIRLTNGEKTLIDVIQELSTKYGKDRSFDEETFIDEFVSLVHPDLRGFFTNYVEGREELPYSNVFASVGLTYDEFIEIDMPEDILKDNGAKASRSIIGVDQTIKKVKKKKDDVGFKKGDIVSKDISWKYLRDDNGHYLPEGTVIDLPIERNGENITLPYTVKYKKGEVKHLVRINKERTEEQVRLYNIWLGLDQ